MLPKIDYSSNNLEARGLGRGGSRVFFITRGMYDGNESKSNVYLAIILSLSAANQNSHRVVATPCSAPDWNGEIFSSHWLTVVRFQQNFLPGGKR